MLQLREGESLFVQAYWRKEYVDCLLAMRLRPIFVEVTSFNMAMDPLLLGKHLERMTNAGTPLPRAIIVAHAHGIPANMELLCEVAQRYNMTLSLIHICIVPSDCRYLVGSLQKPLAPAGCLATVCSYAEQRGLRTLPVA